jgi:hypothetical protein
MKTKAEKRPAAPAAGRRGPAPGPVPAKFASPLEVVGLFHQLLRENSPCHFSRLDVMGPSDEIVRGFELETALPPLRGSASGATATPTVWVQFLHRRCEVSLLVDAAEEYLPTGPLARFSYSDPALFANLFRRLEALNLTLRAGIGKKLQAAQEEWDASRAACRAQDPWERR